jgi:hypothetical protein
MRHRVISPGACRRTSRTSRWHVHAHGRQINRYTHTHKTHTHTHTAAVKDTAKRQTQKMKQTKKANTHARERTRSSMCRTPRTYTGSPTDKKHGMATHEPTQIAHARNNQRTHMQAHIMPRRVHAHARRTRTTTGCADDSKQPPRSAPIGAGSTLRARTTTASGRVVPSAATILRTAVYTALRIPAPVRARTLMRHHTYSFNAAARRAPESIPFACTGSCRTRLNASSARRRTRSRETILWHNAQMLCICAGCFS